MSFDIKQAVSSWRASLKSETHPLKKVALKVAIYQGYVTELDRVIRLQVLEGVTGVPFGKYTSGHKNSKKLLTQLEATLLGEGYTDIDRTWFQVENSGLANHLERQAKKVLFFEEDQIQDDVVMYLITGSSSTAPLQAWSDEEWKMVDLDPVLDRQPAAYKLGRTNAAEILSGKQKVSDISRILGSRVKDQAKTIWLRETKRRQKEEYLNDEQSQVEKMVHKDTYGDFRYKTKFTGVGDFAWGIMDDPKNELGRKLKDAFTDAFISNAQFYKDSSGELKNYALAGWLWWQALRKAGGSLLKKKSDRGIMKQVKEELERMGLNVTYSDLTKGSDAATPDMTMETIQSMGKSQGYIWKSMVLAGQYVKAHHPELFDRLDDAWSLYTGPGLGRKLAAKQMHHVLKTSQNMIKSATLRWDDDYVWLRGKKVQPKQAVCYLNDIPEGNILAAKEGHKLGWVLQKQPNGIPLYRFGHVQILPKNQ